MTQFIELTDGDLEKCLVGINHIVYILDMGKLEDEAIDEGTKARIFLNSHTGKDRSSLSKFIDVQETYDEIRNIIHQAKHSTSPIINI